MGYPLSEVRSRIVGFREDEQGDWIAELDCGHAQHLRHNPPWTNRLWVTTSEGREEFLGHELFCPVCSATRNVTAQRSEP